MVLPGYFEEFNRDFRYQTTVIAQFAQFAQSVMAKKNANNRFVIRSSK